MAKIRLNPLQARTLALFQELAADEEIAVRDEESGGIRIHALPRAHGDHMHVGRFSVSSRFASGLTNENVWRVLERKGLIHPDFPHSVLLLPEGLAFETGIRERMLAESDH